MIGNYETYLYIITIVNFCLLYHNLGYLMQRKDHAKMISDSNSTKHEENGNANLREDKRVPLHFCCCCGSGCNFKTRRKCSSCTNNDLRNCQHLKPNTLRACHNSTKYI